MMYQEAFVGAVAALLIATVRPAVGHTTPCLYESYKCGSSLFTTGGYNSTEFEAAANLTGTIPPLTDFQLLDVLYRCIDINGDIAGNSYCISGCIEMGSSANDQCAM